MRIGVVTTSYPRSPGEPAGGFVADLNQWLVRAGHHVEVLAAGPPKSDDRWHTEPVHRIHAASGLFYEGGAPDALKSRRQAFAAALFSARMSLQVRRRAGHWDGMVAHWLAPSALACALASPRTPLWAIAHGGDVHLLAKLGLTAAAARILDKPTVRLSFVSNSARTTFVQAAGSVAHRLIDRSIVCPMGIDLAHWQSLPKTRAKQRRPLVLFLGRLIRLKGVDVLLDALDGLDRECQVVIAGAGPEEAALKARASALGLSVQWPGEVRGAERDELLARSEVVVLPSRDIGRRCEGMPLVALEALAVGAQILVTESGGLEEIPASLCRRVPPDAPTSLRLALRDILDGGVAPESSNAWLASHGWSQVAPRLLAGLR